jgi:hypothetical protein
MDQALIAYFDERFRENAQHVTQEISQQIQVLRVETFQQFQELRAETSQQFQELRVETSQQFQGLRAETSQQFQELRAETSQQFQELREETSRRFDKAESSARQTLVVVEDLRDEVHLVAEAFLGLSQRVERLEDQGTLSFETVQGWMEPFFKSAEERGRELDARSAQLDVPVKDLDNRVRVLEGWAGRQGETVMESTARMVSRYRAKPPLPPE